jgi:hypothetical protein
MDRRFVRHTANIDGERVTWFVEHITNRFGVDVFSKPMCFEKNGNPMNASDGAELLSTHHIAWYVSP